MQWLLEIEDIFSLCDLSQKQALQLALSAREHFWNTMSGHNPKVKKAVCPSGTFEYQNLQYVYMCSDLGTKAKAVNYLTPIFTKTAIEKGFKDYHFTVSKGKLAVPIGDGDSLAVDFFQFKRLSPSPLFPLFFSSPSSPLPSFPLFFSSPPPPSFLPPSFPLSFLLFFPPSFL